ncbi:MAG: tyrosine-type recombinase/integrase [Spirochaetaceae bacterium]|nr:tyrosine-type recombinase/integrase [Spirochaetaceae bacterium]
MASGRKMQWFPTEFKGVRYRHGYQKKDGVERLRKNGAKPDKYFALHYKMAGRVYDEPLGWESDGWNAEKAALELAKLKENRTKGGPKTLRESKDRAEAERKADAARKKAEADAAKTLEEYWSETYLPSAKQLKKECSWEKEESHFRLWIGPLMGGMPIKNIDLPQWDELTKSLSTAGKSQRTKLYVTGTLRRILKHAFERRMINEGPPSGKRVGVSSPGNNRRMRVISDDEEFVIMKELESRDPNAWRITRFAFLTGCRASEAFRLVWSNIDFSRRCLTFSQTKNSDTRILPLTPPLHELFDTMEKGEPEGLVFPMKDGTPYLEAPNVFRTVVDKLELNEGRSKRDRMVFHSIRHTVATRLSAKLGPRDLMDVMGWRTVQMAMRYVHSNDDAKLKALSSLGSAPEEGKILPFPAQA